MSGSTCLASLLAASIRSIVCSNLGASGVYCLQFGGVREQRLPCSLKMPPKAKPLMRSAFDREFDHAARSRSPYGGSVAGRTDASNDVIELPARMIPPRLHADLFTGRGDKPHLRRLIKGKTYFIVPESECGGFADKFEPYEPEDAGPSTSRKRKAPLPLDAPGKMRRIAWGKEVVQHAEEFINKVAKAENIDQVPKDTDFSKMISSLSAKHSSISERSYTEDVDEMLDLLMQNSAIITCLRDYVKNYKEWVRSGKDEELADRIEVVKVNPDVAEHIHNKAVRNLPMFLINDLVLARMEVAKKQKDMVSFYEVLGEAPDDHSQQKLIVRVMKKIQRLSAGHGHTSYSCLCQIVIPPPS